MFIVKEEGNTLLEFFVVVDLRNLTHRLYLNGPNISETKLVCTSEYSQFTNITQTPSFSQKPNSLLISSVGEIIQQKKSSTAFSTFEIIKDSTTSSEISFTHIQNICQSKQTPLNATCCYLSSKASILIYDGKVI